MFFHDDLRSKFDLCLTKQVTKRFKILKRQTQNIDFRLHVHSHGNKHYLTYNPANDNVNMYYSLLNLYELHVHVYFQDSNVKLILPKQSLYYAYSQCGWNKKNKMQISRK